LVIDLADWKAEELPGYEGRAFAVDGTSSVAGLGDARIYPDLGAESPWPLLAAIISIASNGALICVPITAKQSAIATSCRATTLAD
jgi:hypothetical protein